MMMFTPKTARLALSTLAGILLGVLVVLVLALLIRTWSVTGAIRDTQTTNTGILENSEDTLAEIRSCTDPEGVCAKRGQKATGDAIASINQYGLYVVTCADQPGQQTEAELRECADRLQALSARKP